MVVLSAAEGEDKPAKYPTAFLNADTVVITKTDLAPYVDVDIDVMKRYVTGINPRAIIFETAKKDGVYMADQLVDYIIDQARRKKGV